MKRITPYLCILLALFSCEDVVEVDVPEEEPRLIVEALVRIDESQALFRPIVKVSLTSSFFGSIPVTGLTDISILNLALSVAGENSFIVLEEIEEGSGLYQDPDPVGLDFFANGELILQLTHEGRLYFARAEYARAVPIDNLQQGDETLFDDDDVELEITITDRGDTDDYYVMDFGEGEFLALEDEFFNGEEFNFSYFPERTLEPGDQITVSILGADRPFFNYMDLLVEQTFDNQGVFETPVATVRGNIFDVTELDNIDVFDNVEQPDIFPLGYFAIVQEYKQTITIE